MVDDVSVTVPISCTMSGTGMNTHTATLVNGTYTPDIGTTTLHAFCNDSEGFAIYATGYTGNDIGTTNSNKLVGTSASNNATIETGLATSAGNPDISNWAMKLTATQDSGDTTGTNALTIDSAPNTSGGQATSFSQYHVVPNEYTKVAHKNSATDMTASTGGVKLTTTYAAYISKTQVADTYTGQVIYTLVHPSDSNPPIKSNQIGVTYNSNGLSFNQAGTKKTNYVTYEYNDVDIYGNVGENPEIIKTDNLDWDGTQERSYSDSSVFACGETGEQSNPPCLNTDHAEFEDASKLKVVVSYGLSYDEGYCEGESCFYSDYDLGIYGEDGEISYIAGYNDGDQSGASTYLVDGSYIDVFMFALGEAEADYDYGVYIQVYPIYDEPTEDTTYEVIDTVPSVNPVIGSYTETTTWNNKWYAIIGGETIWFEDETVVENYLLENRNSLFGTNIELYAYNPYKIFYDGNGATAGTMNGFYTAVNTNTANSVADLMAPNFKKVNYGFAGWSTSPNTTVNSNSKIYGPNEKVIGNELYYNSNRETTLYAIWVPSNGNMQSFSCSSLSSGQVTALTDTRDNNTYTVGKLADGNCWMMENLRLDAANSSDSSKAQGFGGVFTGLANSEDNYFGNSYTNANSKYSTSNIAGNYQGRRFPRYNNNNINIGGTNSAGTVLTVTPGPWDADRSDLVNNSSHVQWYGYGNYYTWAAAMASTVDLTADTTSESAGTSICPLGWMIPTGKNSYEGSNNGSFSYLDIQLGGNGQNDNGQEVSNRWRSYPNNFVYSGYWAASKPSGRGTSGSYWTRSAAGTSSPNNARSLWFTSSAVSAGTSLLPKATGRSIRCMSQ